MSVNLKSIVLSAVSIVFAHAALSAEPNAFLLEGLSANSVYSWSDCANWKEGYCPVNAGDVVFLGSAETTSRHMLTIPNGSVFSIDSIVEAPEHTYLRFVSGQKISRVTVRQMSGYSSAWPIGFWYNQNWKANAAYSGFYFTGDENEPTVLNSYYLGTLPYFGVPAAGGKARINKMMHKGMFVKEGPGELAVRGPVGPDSGAFVIGGGLVLDAAMESTDESPAPGAFCHVDAARNVYAYRDEASGLNFVTNWYDATLNGFGASNNGTWKMNGDLLWGCPHIAEKTVNGRPLIDFGRYRSKDEAPGDDSPSGALNWNAAATNVREIFMAVEMKDDFGTATAPVAAIGNNGVCPFLMYSTTNSLFFQGHIVRTADVRVDGSPLVPQDDASDPFRVRVISCKVTSGQSANAFGRAANNGRGGFLLGEALVYTNELSEVERRRTIAYLKKRWISAAERPVEREEWDFGDIAVSNATIGVGAGSAVRVKRVQDTCAAAGLKSDGVVKTGDGTLLVDRVVPSDVPITVNGGSVRFTSVAETPSFSNLPAGALINFDAESSDFEYDEGSEEDVTAWYSLANPSKFVATNDVSSDGQRTDCPKRVAAATPTGLHAVDFLSRDITANADTRSNPKYRFPAAPVYSGFIVWKNNYDKHYRASHFCDSGKAMIDRAKGQILAMNHFDSFATAAGMNWRVNGFAVNPLDQTFAAFKGDGAVKDCDWVLISFDSSIPVNLDGMARSAGGNSGGGCLVAALVGYDRPLADHERRQAEAYLMKRYLGKDHPDSSRWNGALGFGEGVENAVSTDVDLAPSAVSFSSTSFTKSGIGRLSLGNEVADLSSVTVAGGELEADIPGGDLCADAFAHFDASKKNTLEMTANGDGTYSVSKWHDVRGNGLYAEADLVHCHTSPKYTEAAAGLVEGLGYVDFGPTSIQSSNKATNEYSAAMVWSKESTEVREVHLVYADADYANDNGKIGNPVAYAIDKSNQSGFIRASKKHLLYGNYNNMLCDTSLDGETVAQTMIKPDGFGVVSFVVTNHLTDALHIGQLNSFCNERNLSFGGVKLAEVIVFETEQTPERRRMIDAKLLKKWRGIGALPAINVALPSVAVAKGAKAKFAIDGEDAAAVLSGINVEWDGVTAGTMIVDGPVDLSRPATVSLTFASGTRPLTSGRRVKVLEAKEFLSSEALSAWTLELPAEARASGRLVVSGSSLYVQFDYCGTMMIVK